MECPRTQASTDGDGDETQPADTGGSKGLQTSTRRSARYKAVVTRCMQMQDCPRLPGRADSTAASTRSSMCLVQ
jgi:hypothetical protein